MAEAAGLTLGGIALASLFSTCIEMLEYFEKGKNLTRDLGVALTKVNLMKRRLSQWGSAMAVNPPGAEAQVLRDRWPIESGVIIESLSGIQDILNTTTKVCRKYQWCNKDKLQWADDHRPEASLLEPAGTIRCSSRPPQRRSVLHTVHRKLAWVIQDRKRVESLIADFDFLLSNLEKIGERLINERQMDRAKEGVLNLCFVVNLSMRPRSELRTDPRPHED